MIIVGMIMDALMTIAILIGGGIVLNVGIDEEKIDRHVRKGCASQLLFVGLVLLMITARGGSNKATKLELEVQQLQQQILQIQQEAAESTAPSEDPLLESVSQ